MLAIQNVVYERRRGVATSLVPFSRTIGGSLGVGAIGGLLAAGLSAGGPAAETAGRILAAGSQAGGGGAIAPAAFRVAIERSLLPVFGILCALAIVNVFVTERFPSDAEMVAEPLAVETEIPG